VSSSRKAFILLAGVVVGGVGVLLLDAFDTSEPVKLRWRHEPGRAALYECVAEVNRDGSRPGSDGGSVRQRITEEQHVNLWRIEYRQGDTDTRAHLYEWVSRRLLSRIFDGRDVTEGSKAAFARDLPLPDFRFYRPDELGRSNRAVSEPALRQLHAVVPCLHVLPVESVTPGAEWNGRLTFDRASAVYRFRLDSVRRDEVGRAASVSGEVDLFFGTRKVGRVVLSYEIDLDAGLLRREEVEVEFVGLRRRLEHFDRVETFSYSERYTLRLLRTMRLRPEPLARQMAQMEAYEAALRNGEAEKVLEHLTAAGDAYEDPDNPVYRVAVLLRDAAEEVLAAAHERAVLKELSRRLRELWKKHAHHHHGDGEDRHDHQDRRDEPRGAPPEREGPEGE